MFRKQGWSVTSDLGSADLIQFCGGADVNPALYGQVKHPNTYFREERDTIDIMALKLARKLDKPVAGICRGGQFLNVMCGGSMWQDVEGHAMMGVHEAFDFRTKKNLQVTSTHHQMMRGGKGSTLVLAATKSKWKERCGIAGNTFRSYDRQVYDTEALFYEKHKAFCFQPHPEFEGHDELATAYFGYLNELLHV
jgi:carbamoylphosphate synthase small subunit